MKNQFNITRDQINHLSENSENSKFSLQQWFPDAFPLQEDPKKTYAFKGNSGRFFKLAIISKRYSFIGLDQLVETVSFQTFREALEWHEKQGNIVMRFDNMYQLLEYIRTHSK